MKPLAIILICLIPFISCNTPNNKGQLAEAIPMLQRDTVFTFNSGEEGISPSGWSQYVTGEGKMPNWITLKYSGKHMLGQVSNDHPNYPFNKLVFDGFKAKNVELRVKMKGITGKINQGGGFIWRFIDQDNYYQLGADPLKNNIVLYKVENGKRTELPILGEGKSTRIEIGQISDRWNILKIQAIDNIFTVFLNGFEKFQVEDNTFQNAGKVGLWTKADAVTYFDDLEVRGL